MLLLKKGITFLIILFCISLSFSERITGDSTVNYVDSLKSSAVSSQVDSLAGSLLVNEEASLEVEYEPGYPVANCKSCIDSLKNELQSIYVKMDSLTSCLTDINKYLQNNGTKLDSTLQTVHELRKSRFENFKPRFAIGYDEGLGGKYLLSPRLNVSAYVGYWFKGADTVTSNHLNFFSWKIGSAYQLYKKERLKISALLEFKQNIEQLELPPLNGFVTTTRYNLFTSKIRVGTTLELFLLSRLSISYKLCLETVFHGSHTGIDSSGQSTIDLNDSYVEFGTNFTGNDIFEKLLNNIAIHVYF